MKREELKKLELSDEAIDAVMKLHGDDIEATKTKLDKSAELTALQAQLDEANKQIEGFKKLDPEKIQQAAADWEQKANDFKAQAEQAQKDADAKVAALQFDRALESALSGAKAKSIKAVRALLDVDALKLGNDGSISGLEDQIKKLAKEQDYLFESAEQTPRIVAGGNNHKVVSSPLSDAVFRGANLKPPETK